MAIMATYTHCLAGTLQEWDYLSKIIQERDYSSKIIQDYMDISKCEMKMSMRWRWAWDMIEWHALMKSFRRSSGSMFKIGFEIWKLIEERYAKVQLS